MSSDAIQQTDKPDSTDSMNMPPAAKGSAFLSTLCREHGWETLRSSAVMAVLLGIGWYGHHSHWSLPWGHVSHNQAETSTHAQASEAKAANAADASDEHPSEVNFRNDEAVQLAGITTAEVTRMSIAEEIPAHGVVEYDHRLVARISSRVNGTIWRVEKHLGDTVSKGDVLAVIEAVSVGDAKAEFLSALAVAESRTEQRERLDELPEVVSPKALREATLSEREALVRLRNAEQTLINLGMPLRYQDYQNLTDIERFDRLQFLGLPASLVDHLDRHQTTSNLAPLMAPFEGQVISRDVGLGEVVTTEDTLFQVADSSRMWLLLDVRKEDARQLRIGQPLSFTADGLDTEIESQIDWISTEVDEETRTVRIRAQVENPIVSGSPSNGEQRLLRANTFGTARIRIREHSGAMVVPRECVQWDQEGHVVYVQTAARRYRAIRVSTGIAMDGKVEIHGDLQPGMIVVQKGSHLLKSETLLSRLASVTP